MKKMFALLSIIAFLTGCGESGIKTTNHKICLEEFGGKLHYDGQCRSIENIPEDKQEEVILDFADEIADERGISREQALMEILAVLESHAK
jgi:hypothetical protein